MTFEPENELSLRQMVLEGLKSLAPLEPGTVITFDQISEWVNRPFPLPSVSAKGWVLPNYSPMDDVKADVLANWGALLVPHEGDGYRVATDAEMVAWADDRFRKAARVLRDAACAVSAARTERLSPRDAEMAKEIEAEARLEARVLRAKRRAWITRRNRWNPTST